MHALGVRRLSGHRSLVAATIAVCLGLAGVSSAVASTGVVPGSARQAAVQAVLDRIVGPGNSIVEIADTVQTSTTTRTAVAWGAATPSRIAWSTQTAGTGGSSATVRHDVVDGTQTVTATPAGSLVRQSVTVAIDRRHLGSASVPRIRRLVSAAAGVVSGRGDRVSILVTRFAATPATPATARYSIWSVLTANPAPAALTALGALLLLVLVGRGLMRRALRRPDTA